MRFPYSLWKVCIGFVIISLLSVGCSTATQQTSGKEGEKPGKAADTTAALSIGTMSVGSIYHVMAVGISTLVQKQTGIESSVEPGGGADTLVRGIGENRLDLALSTTLAAADGYYARPPHKSKVKVWLIAQGGSAVRNIVARADAGIKTPADLKGKKLLAKRKSVADLEEISLAMLKVWGVPEGDVKLLEVAEINEAVEALKLGTAHAGVLPASLNSAVLKDLAESTPIVFLDMGPKMQEMLKELNPAMFSETVPAGMYKGLDNPVQSISAGRAALVAQGDLPEEVVYQITKVIFSDPEELKKIHASGRDWTLKNTLDSFPVPFHPGAVKYFKEVGKWTDAQEKRQQELLAK